MHLRPVAAFLAVAALVAAACGSPTTPAASPGASGAPGASSSPSAAAAGTGSYTLIGWRGREVLLSLSDLSVGGHSWVIAINTATSSWQARSLPGTIAPTGAVSDGTRIAFAIGGSIVVEDAKGGRSVLPAPDGANLPDGWAAGGLVALARGGFAVRGASSLITVDAKATKISVAALPSGFVLAGATSDPTRFLLAPTGSLDAASGAAISLWTVGDKTPVPAATGVLSISPATDELAYLRTATGYLALGTDGTTTTAATLPAGPATITPDGALAAVAACLPTSGCTISRGVPGKLGKLDVTASAIAAVALAPDGELALLGPDPTTAAAPATFSVIDAKGVAVSFSLPTVTLLTPPAPAASPNASASPSVAPAASTKP